MTSFNGGQLPHFIEKWAKITSDPTVLKVFFIDFSTWPKQTKGPHKKIFSISDSLIIADEIQKLVDKGVLGPSEHGIGRTFHLFKVVLEANTFFIASIFSHLKVYEKRNVDAKF